MTTTPATPTRAGDRREAVLAPPPPPRLWWADVSVAAAAGSMLVVVALWVANRGIQGLGTAPLSSLGRLTGLVASDLLLLQVLLMARIPVVERSFGQDALVRRHRSVGFWSFWLMITHIVLVTLGYAAADGSGVPAEAWDLVTTAPGVLLAVAGMVALVAVVALSVRAARRRLRYESWHLIHLYAYLGVGLALPHQLWTGTDLTASPVARTYWWGVYLLTLGAVLVFRLGLPAWRTAYHRLRVATVVHEAPGVVSVYLTGRHLDRLPARAGQFFGWRFPRRTGLEPSAPVLAVRRAAERLAADHGQGPR